MYILFEKDKNKGLARIVLQLSEEAKFGREAVSVDTVAARWEQRPAPAGANAVWGGG